MTTPVHGGCGCPQPGATHGFCMCRRCGRRDDRVCETCGMRDIVVTRPKGRQTRAEKIEYRTLKEAAVAFRAANRGIPHSGS